MRTGSLSVRILFSDDLLVDSISKVSCVYHEPVVCGSVRVTSGPTRRCPIGGVSDRKSLPVTKAWNMRCPRPVSYTHLTLPTICSV
eukprot:7376636-Prymnesium_polylepis.2